jgi:hypothetical protein
VGGGVVAQLALVARGGEHLALAHEHGAYRDVIVLGRALRLAEGQPHEVLVATEEGAVRRGQVVRTM